MRIFTVSMFACIMLIGCTFNFSTEVTVNTETEEKAVEAVNTFYGGNCQTKKGVKNDSDENQVYFQMTIDQSPLVNSYAQLPMLPASNAAYLFYSNLEDEKTNYDQINVDLIIDSLEYNFEFGTKALAKVESLMRVWDNTLLAIQNQDYEAIHKAIEPKIAEEINPEQFEQFFTSMDSVYGPIQQGQFHGFHLNQQVGEVPDTLVRFSGVMIREKENTPFRILFHPKTRNIFGLQHDF